MKIKFKPVIILLILLVVIVFIGISKFDVFKEKKSQLSKTKISQLLNIIGNSNDNEKIKEAVIMLGNHEVSDKKVVKALKKLAKNNNDDEIKKESIFSLTFIQNNEILPFFEELLKTQKDAKSRKYVILALKYINTKETNNILFSVIDNDKDFEVRSTAAYILGQKKEKKFSKKFINNLKLVVPQKLAKESVHFIALIDILNNFVKEFSETDNHKEYFSNITSVNDDIKMIEEFLIHLKDKKTVKLKERAFIALERVKLFETMLANVLSSEKDEDVIKSGDNALDVVEKIESLINIFIKVNEEQEERMILATIALGEMKIKNAVPRFIEIMENTENTWLKREIVVALGNIGDSRAVEMLVDRLGKERHKEFDEDIIVSLGQIKGKRAKVALLDILGSDQNKWIKIKALEALEGMKSKAVVDELCIILGKEEDVEVKLAIVTFFKYCKSKKAEMELKNLVFDKSEDNELRLSAINTYINSEHINRREKIVLKKEIIDKLTEDVTDEEKIFILDVISELKIIDALPKVKSLIKNKNPKLRSRANEVVNILNKKN